MFGGAMNIELYNKALFIFENNFYLSNKAWGVEGVGGGSVFKISSSLLSINSIFSSNCIYLSNTGQAKG